MTFQEYRQHDATALIELLQNGQVTALELMELAIRRAEAVNPSLNAIVTPLYELGRAMAAAADTSHTFAGLPFLIKDLSLEIKGQKAQGGVRAMRDYVSQQDSYLVRQFREHGLAFMGKTNTPELGLTPYTESLLYGKASNPWDLERTTGGSSGGSAAAIAAGIVPLATASDGGGSIRIPASCCGLFGLKPSRGRLSLGPQYGEVWCGAVVEGCNSRSVRDAALFYDTFSGPACGEPYFAPAPSRSYREEATQDPVPLRIGYSVAHTLGMAVDPACQAAVADTVQLLTELGHQVEEVALPYRHEDLSEVFLMMTFGETNATLRQLGDALGRPLRPGDVEDETYALAMLGASFSAGDYAYQKDRWNEISRRIGQFHESYDLLLTPTLASRPFLHGHLQASPMEKKLLYFVTRTGLTSVLKAKVGELAEKVFSFIPWTPLANMTGQPSMSVPLYWTRERSEEDLPIGSMFTAALYREDLLFQLAGQLERARPWLDRIP